jgi:DHA1 family bicyclomycin/chloramphenicol resistance-like MFS transporter
MIFGLVLFSLAGIGCVFAPSIHIFLSCRCIQGVAAGAAAVLPAAIVRDVFSGLEGRKRQSYVALFNYGGPLVAPLLGAAVMTAGGNWRAIFLLLGAGGLVLLGVCYIGFSETLPAERRASRSKAMLSGYGSVVRDKRYLIATALQTLSFCGMFAFISASPLILMNNYGLSSSAFGLVFAATAAGSIIGSAANSYLLGRHVSHLRLLGTGVVVSAFAAGGLFILAESGNATVLLITILVIVSNICVGIVVPNTTHSALEGLASIAGTGSALLRSTQMLGGAAASVLVARLYDGQSAKAMSLVMAGCALGSVVCLLLGVKHLTAELLIPTEDAMATSKLDV